MNNERILALADFIEESVEPLKFTMNSFGVSYFEAQDANADYKFNLEKPLGCGTRGCIAGWTLVKFKENIPDVAEAALAESDEFGGDMVAITAAKLLDLTNDEADDLFFPVDWAKSPTWNDITPPVAAAHLRSLVVKTES